MNFDFKFPNNPDNCLNLSVGLYTAMLTALRQMYLPPTLLPALHCKCSVTCWSGTSMILSSSVVIKFYLHAPEFVQTID